MGQHEFYSSVRAFVFTPQRVEFSKLYIHPECARSAFKCMQNSHVTGDNANASFDPFTNAVTRWIMLTNQDSPKYMLIETVHERRDQ